MAAAAPAAAPSAPEAVAPADGYRRAFEAAERKAQGGNFLGAVADYRKALLFRETSEAWAGLGRALYDGNQPGPALEALQRAVALDAANADAHLTLGEVYLLENRKADARASYERYLALQPQGAHARDVRAVLERLR